VRIACCRAAIRSNAPVKSPTRHSDSIADEADDQAQEKLPRGRAKAVRPLEANDDGDNSADAPQTTRQGAARSSRGPAWAPYR
jgi:hypothetical protein